MCGRFTQTQSGIAIAQAFQLTEAPALQPRYNIAPTQAIAVVKALSDSGRQLQLLRWGLIPAWSKDSSIGARLINARAETVAEKPAFRNAFKKRRCLVVADGFYEWQRLAGKKQPYYFHLSQKQPFAFAGLWEHWQDKDGTEIQSCTILTTEANELLSPIHDRMPVILPPQAYDQWLDPDLQDTRQLQSWLRPYAAEAMATYPVSLEVNRPGNDSLTCIQAVQLNSL